MAKKKSSSPKLKAPRPKRLKLVDTSPIGLTGEQQRELKQRYSHLAHITGSGLSLDDKEGNRRFILDRFLYLYIESLCQDARADELGSKKRPLTTLRRSVLKGLQKAMGRELSPNDIIQELAKHAAVPMFAADAIRRDYLRITV